MKKLIRKRICSYAPNIGTGATVYAYETQAAYQDNTRVEQLSPEQIQRMNEERERNKGLVAHTEAVVDISVQTAIAAGAGAIVGGPAGAAGAAVGTAAVSTYQSCNNCHKKD